MLFVLVNVRTDDNYRRKYLSCHKKGLYEVPGNICETYVNECFRKFWFSYEIEKVRSPVLFGCIETIICLYVDKSYLYS